MWRWVATVSVSRNGTPIGVMTTEKRQYITTQQPVTEVGVRSTAMEDLYLILASVENMQGLLANDPGAERITLQILVNPLVGWIWFGGLVMSVGALIALWPTGDSSARRQPRTADAAATAGAAA
jgi:cytochrome c-type biogenesis protein CcmF